MRLWASFCGGEAHPRTESNGFLAQNEPIGALARVQPTGFYGEAPISGSPHFGLLT